MTRLLREKLARAGTGKTADFRWRGGEVSRIGIHGALAGRRRGKIAREEASSSAPRASPEAALPTTEA